MKNHPTINSSRLAIVIAVGLLCTSIQVAGKEPARVDFGRDVRPILNRCIKVNIRLVPFAAPQP